MAPPQVEQETVHARKINLLHPSSVAQVGRLWVWVDRAGRAVRSTGGGGPRQPAGCQTADEAVRIARMARAMGFEPWVKLEVIPDAKYLLPDPVGTLAAARLLVAEGFSVLPYIGADPPLARQLEEIGCATVMPLASPIGSGQGLVNLEAIRIIIEQATVPVVVDAGIGAPSDAALAMEQGADACLVNTAVALAQNPALMAEAIAAGVSAGRQAFLAGRIPRLAYASASSPLSGVVGA